MTSTSSSDSNGGWHMETRLTLGRVLVADKTFHLGDVVVEEEPMLVWVDGVGRCESLIRAFLAASAETQAAVLDMGHPLAGDDDDDENSVPFVAVARKEAAALAASDAEFANMGTARLMELLLIDATNAHSYHGGMRSAARSVIVLPRANDSGNADVIALSGGATSATAATATPVPLRQKQCALFFCASKVAHACRPNTVYTSTGTGGRLRYIASRLIVPGDLITFSYIESLQPRAGRRAALLEGKFFHCECARCVGVDDCRGLRCSLTVGCRGTLLRADETVVIATNDVNERREGGEWTCTACSRNALDATLVEPLAIEASVTDAVFWLKSRLDAGDAEIPIAIIEATINGAAARLPLSHYSVIVGVRLLVGVYMGEARAADAAGEKNDAREWFLRSALTGYLRVRLLECLEAQCKAGGACCDDHGPSLSAVVDALWATYDAVASESPIGLLLATRYLPLLRARFGTSDTDVLRVSDIINNNANTPHHHQQQQVVAAAALTSVDVAAAAVFRNGTVSSKLLLTDDATTLKTCAGCNKSETSCLLRCSRCQNVVYCGDICQKKDWAKHKGGCVAKR